MATTNAISNKTGTLTVDNALTVTAGGASITGTSTIDGSNAAVTIKSGTGQLDVSADAAATTVNIATGAGAKTVTLGSTNTTSKLDLKFGTADFSLASATGTVISALDTGEVTMPLQSAVLAYNSETDSKVTGDGTVITVVYDTEIYDQNSDYNNGTGVFTAPVTGRYHLSTFISLLDIASGHTQWNVDAISSNRAYALASVNAYAISVPAYKSLTQNMSTYLDMDAGDTVYISTAVYHSTKVVSVVGGVGSGVYTGFGIHLVC